MVTVTELAKEELKNILSAAGMSDPEVGLRLAPAATGQFGLMTNKEQEGDQVVEHGDSKVLMIGTELTDTLEGVTIDCQDTAEGSRLVMSKD